MKKIIFITLILINVVVFASNENWRNLVIAQFREIAEPLFDHGEATKPKFDTFYTDMVEGFDHQQKVEKSLELAINRFDGASSYIIENAQSWKDDLGNTKQLSSLVSIALNSPLIEVRMAGFEIFLAQNKLDKTPEQVDKLINNMQQKPRNAPWNMWAMAAIAARGIDRDRIFDELLYATTDENDKNRRWAVDALAKFGGEEVVVPLLEIARYDSSPIIQERAFCGLASSGTLNIAERYSALTGLLEISQDPQTNQQTLAWVYQALKEISHIYNIADDPEMWQKKLEELNLLNDSF